MTAHSHAHVATRTMFYGLGGRGIRMYSKGMQARPVKTVKVRFRFFSTRWNLCGSDRRFPPMATLDGPEPSSRHDSRPPVLCVSEGSDMANTHGLTTWLKLPMIGGRLDQQTLSCISECDQGQCCEIRTAFKIGLLAFRHLPQRMSAASCPL